MAEHRRGPIRSEVARVAILEATARQFEARGYDHLTMEGIAAEAKVGKQTIYRWWPSKGAIVVDCMIEGLLFQQGVNPPDTGDIRADLRSWLVEVFDFMRNQGGDSLVRSLVAAAVENPDIGVRLNDSLGASSLLLHRLQAAVDAGELAEGTPLEEIGEALVGVLVLRALDRSPTDADQAARLVDALLGTTATQR